MAYWHLHNRGGRIVLSLVLGQTADISNSTLGFFLVDLTHLVLTGNLIQKVLKEGFRCLSPLCRFINANVQRSRVQRPPRWETPALRSLCPNSRG